MAKKPFPLLKRIQVALNETCSDNQRKVVYNLLQNYMEKHKTYIFDKFYGDLTHTTLSPIHNHIEQYDEKKVELGQKLEQFLETSLMLPESGRDDYLKKMREVRTKEFELLQNYKKNESNN